MAEGVAALGLVSAIIQLADFGSKIIDRLNEFQSDTGQTPRAFRDIKTQLPLLLNALQRTKAQAEAGDINGDVQYALLSVVEGCQSQIQLLDNTLAKTLPAKGDSRWRRGMKVLLSVRQEKDIRQVVRSLQTYISTLTFHQVAGPPRDLPVRSKPLFTVPFERDPDFVVRSDILMQIDQRLRSHGRVALAGIGGAGKSQIAVEFCYRFRAAHPESWVLWVHASTVARFDESYKEIARKARLPGWNDPNVNTLKLVFEWLSDESPYRWLLILDSADDEEVFFSAENDWSEMMERKKALANYIPRSSTGSAIITTRDLRVGQRLTNRAKPITVSPMVAWEAKQLLHSKIPEGDTSNETNSENLLHALGYLPLAITQAAAFISENSMTVNEYLDALQTSDEYIKDLLSQELEDSRRYSDTLNSVVQTWKLSFDQIRVRKPRAAEILSLMSVLDRQGIPMSLLEREDEHSVEFATAIGTLQAFSLITAERAGKTFEMHRLVQLSTQRWLEVEGTILQYQQEALELLSKAFPPGFFEEWATCNQLVPHAQTALKYSLGTEASQLHRAALLNNVSVYDREQGRYETAFAYCSEALVTKQNVLGAEHPDTLAAGCTLGMILSAQGKYEEAEKLHQEVLEAQERVLGVEHPHTLDSIHNLAMVFEAQGKYDKAEMLYQQTWKENKKILGEEHPDTLTTANNLASIFIRQGKYEDAERLHQQVLEAKERVLGVEHPNTLYSIHNLAMVLDRQGKYDKAEMLYQQAWKEKKKILGEEHPDTLATVNNLALVFEQQGKYEDAEKLHQQVLEVRERVLGFNHPEILGSIHNLAMVLDKQGKYDKAEMLYQQAWKERKKILGEEHPDTLATVNNLALVFEQQGKYEDAEKLHQQVLEVRERVLGFDHPETLSSIHNLAVAFERQGKHEEAGKLYQQVLEAKERVLGVDHPHTLNSVVGVANVLHCKGQYEAALELYQRALAGYEKRLGPDHPTTILCSRRFSVTLDKLNDTRQVARSANCSSH